MTNELKAAAERVGESLRMAEEGVVEKVALDITYGGDMDGFKRDMQTLSDGSLARLAADEQQAKEDAEPITGHVIASLMPKEQFGEALYIKASFVLSPVSRLSIGGVIGDNRGFNVAIHGNPTITTRGQLRKLLEALEGGA